MNPNDDHGIEWEEDEGLDWSDEDHEDELGDTNEGADQDDDDDDFAEDETEGEDDESSEGSDADGGGEAEDDSDDVTRGEAPQPNEVDVLRQQLEEERRRVAWLQGQQEAALQQNAQRQGTVPEPPRASRAAREAAAELLSTSDAKASFERFKQMPQAVQAEAFELVKEAKRREADFLLDPHDFFRREFGSLVDRHVRSVVEPLQQAASSSEIDRFLTMQQQAGVIEDDRDVTAIGLEARRLAQSLSARLGASVDPRALLHEAAQNVATRKALAKLSKREQKVTSKERQQAANRQAQRGRKPKRGRRRAKAKADTGGPADDDLMDLWHQLEATGDFSALEDQVGLDALE